MGFRYLTDEQLEKLSDKNLLALYKKVRTHLYNNRPDPDYEDFAWDENHAYKVKMKQMLDSRKHVSRKDTEVNINNKTRNRTNAK